MLKSLVIGVFHGIPHSQYIWVEMHERLSSECHIPEIGISIAIDAGRASDDMITIFRHKELAVALFHDTTEEDIVRDIAFGLKDVVAM